jgi:hypothetical protein
MFFRGGCLSESRDFSPHIFAQVLFVPSSFWLVCVGCPGDLACFFLTRSLCATLGGLPQASPETLLSRRRYPGEPCTFVCTVREPGGSMGYLGCRAPLIPLAVLSWAPFFFVVLFSCVFFALFFCWNDCSAVKPCHWGQRSSVARGPMVFLIYGFFRSPSSHSFDQVVSFGRCVCVVILGLLFSVFLLIMEVLSA